MKKLLTLAAALLVFVGGAKAKVTYSMASDDVTFVDSVNCYVNSSGQVVANPSADMEISVNNTPISFLYTCGTSVKTILKPNTSYLQADGKGVTIVIDNLTEGQTVVLNICAKNSTGTTLTATSGASDSEARDKITSTDEGTNVSFSATGGTMKIKESSAGFRLYSVTIYDADETVDTGDTEEGSGEESGGGDTSEDTGSVNTDATDGTETTPQDGSYTNNTTYTGTSYTITTYGTNYFIAGKASKSTALKDGLKLRHGATVGDKTNCFYIDVIDGFVITDVKLSFLPNSDNTTVKLQGVYVDGDTETNLLTVEVGGSSTNSSATADVAEINGISAQEQIAFSFDSSEQLQALLEVTYLSPVSISIDETIGYATMYYEKELIIPDGTTAYTATLSEDNSTLTLNSIDGTVVPASTPAIISGTGGTFKVGATGAAALTSSLDGTAADLATNSITSGTVCVLGSVEGTAGFYKYGGETLGANKAYIVVPAGTSAKGIKIVMGDATGISNVAVEAEAAGGAIYNLAGQQVSESYKGVVVKNGKKYINK